MHDQNHLAPGAARGRADRRGPRERYVVLRDDPRIPAAAGYSDHWRVLTDNAGRPARDNTDDWARVDEASALVAQEPGQQAPGSTTEV